MQHVMKSYRGLSFLVGLNLDRLFAIGTILLSLYAAAFIGSMITPQ